MHYQTNILIKGIWGERVVVGLLKKKNLNERGGMIGQGQRQGRRMGMNEYGQDEQVSGLLLCEYENIEIL